MAVQHDSMIVAHRQLSIKERKILEKPVIVHVGIILPDGTPHVSAMWVDLDGGDIILNTAIMMISSIRLLRLSLKRS